MEPRVFAYQRSNCCSTRYFNKQRKLIGISGKNKFGKVGDWFDENGLCQHEEVSRYCDKCKEQNEPI